MSAPTPLALFLSAFDIATMIAMVGLLACRLAVLPGAADAALEQHMDAATGWALALLTLASLGILVSRTLEMNGGNWSALRSDAQLAVTMTHFGHVWVWRVPALVLAWAAWAWSRQRTDHAWTTWAQALAVAVVVMTRSDTGHMADHGDFAFAVWIDWLHVLAAGAWIGSVFGMSLVIFPQLLRDGQHSLHVAALIFHRLSTLSGVALAMVIACGIYSTIQLLGSITNLWTTSFGINLDIKLGGVFILILIGAHNRYVKLPRLLTGAGIAQRPSAIALLVRAREQSGAPRDSLQVLRSCARAVWIESLLGLCVIGLTSALIHQMPPSDMSSMPTARMANHPMKSMSRDSAKPDEPDTPPATNQVGMDMK